MNLETKKQGEVIFLKLLEKNLDSTISANFKGRVLNLMGQGNSLFVLNLSSVEFIDSSGLGTIISILKNLTLNKGNIAICGANKPILNLLELTRLDRVLHIYPNEEEAVGFLSKKIS